MSESFLAHLKYSRQIFQTILTFVILSPSLRAHFLSSSSLTFH